jgi:PAS domain S-box-containing protein
MRDNSQHDTVAGLKPEPPARARDFLRLTGAAVAAMGLLVGISWVTHWTDVIQLAPGAVSTKFNTAGCFTLCGLAAFALTSRRPRWAVPLAAIVVAVAIFTLFEYLSGTQWRLDQLVVKDYLPDGTIDPGRMSPLTAACFILLGSALIRAGIPRRVDDGLQLLALLSTSVMLIAATSLTGYALGIDTGFGWGIYTRMSVQATLMFFALALALVVWAWRLGRPRGIDLVRWLPATASVTVMGMVALGSSISQAQLENAVNWGRHTYEVLLTTQTLLGQIQDEQRSVRRYAVLDQKESLENVKQAATQAPQTLAELTELVRDSPVQMRRIKSIADDLHELHQYARRLIDIHDASGREAVTKFDNEGNGRLLMDRARTNIQAFSSYEHELLNRRNSVAEQNFRSTGRLTITASLVAAAFLACALLLSDRELMKRRRADARLEESLKLQSEILNSAHYAIVSSTRTGTITSFNAAAERMLGYQAAEVIGRATPALWHDPAELDARAREISNKRGHPLQVSPGSFVSTARPGQSDEAEWTFIRRDGSRFRGSLVVTALTGPDGAVLGYLGILADVTERKKMELLKDEFISTVSHELRTPLTSIRGSLGLLAGGVLGPLSDKAAGMVQIAHQNSERLVRIINDILDIEKIEAGKLELHREPLPLHALLEQAVQVNQAYADKYQVRLALQPVADWDRVMADSDRLMQVMANLLSNAAKFSPPGSTVNIRAARQGARMRIEVEDHGTGIPEEFRSRIFEKFAQADASSSRRFEGTGLGLSITRQLVEAMGGIISFRSTTGKGTTFEIELPCAPDEACYDLPRPPSDTARLRVLFCEEGARMVPDKPRVLHVEDDLDLWRVLQTALEDKADIVTAATLEEAYARLRDEDFSLVLLDLKLPDGDGLSLLERLPHAKPPVVILSATEVPQDVQRRVSAALVKSRVSEAHIVQTILSLVA